jgi:hypothetical protein
MTLLLCNPATVKLLVCNHQAAVSSTHLRRHDRAVLRPYARLSPPHCHEIAVASARGWRGWLGPKLPRTL